MSKPQLILFDCDGVLVDSEFIAAQIESELLTDAGYAISPEEIAERFAGLTWPTILMEIERESSMPISASLIEKSRKLMTERIKKELLTIDGIEDVVSQLAYPKAICSNSSTEALELMLKRSTLYEAFAPHIYAAREVGNKEAKPAPNVYLHAAKQFDADPKRCFVIEDSSHGVLAARAAGMRVIGFTGGAHTYPGHADKLTEAGAETVINRHRDLPAVIEAMAEWDEGF
ncbi:HAD family hydrolase [Pseudochrobactrum sp. MP213Fo]|uniref:HAD family hydrolase n=1 Tax=Pseudochrobactrum sp. MP213Fo TaxID=3022250 RepID=UPI003BA08380